MYEKEIVAIGASEGTAERGKLQTPVSKQQIEVLKIAWRKTFERALEIPENKKQIEETYPKWKNREITGVEFVELLELKKNTFYKIIKEYEENTL